MAVAFSSDFHFFHDNIIKYSNRPFANVDEMNRTIAKNINKVLPNGGTLYFLGDWSMGPLENSWKAKELINPNIDIILLIGNHDKHKLKDQRFRNIFKEIHYVLDAVKISGQTITLCHYAMRTFDKMHYGAWQIYGHSHSTLPDDPNVLSMDVGIDSAYKIVGEFRPFTFDEIALFMSKKTFKALDHHL